MAVIKVSMTVPDEWYRIIREYMRRNGYLRFSDLIRQEFFRKIVVEYYRRMESAEEGGGGEAP